MNEYAVFLLIASLVLVGVYTPLARFIPVEAPVYYLSVGFSLVLGLVLPWFLVALKGPGVVITYILLILVFAVVLTALREKLLPQKDADRTPADPANGYAGQFAVVLTALREKLLPQKDADRTPADPANGYAGKNVGPAAAEIPADPLTFAEILESHQAALVPRPLPNPDPPGAEAEEAREESPPAAVAEDNREAAAGEDETASREAPRGEELEEAGPEPGHPAQEQRPDDTLLAEQERRRAALRDIFQALALRPPLPVRARLTLQLSENYRDLGQYWQAVEVIRTFLASTGGPRDGALLNALVVNAAECQAVLTVLAEEGQAGTAYADLPGELRTRATRLAGKLILQGGWHGEKIPGDH